MDLPAGALLNGGNWTHQGGAITGTGTLKFGSTLNLDSDFTAGGIQLEATGLTVNGPGRFIVPGPEIILNDWTFNAGLDADRDLQVESTSGKINGAFGVRPGRTLRLMAGGTLGLYDPDCGGWV